ncbi:type II secretion system protein GspK [Neptunicella marina]|uniref:General secretion pathway protein GspK n=1 Tax=Neptunicella marina TaxID=2125989 RepID=A0A8J6IMF1_9ALTE|nr:type II secretion system protein GspK [Neptunicella marina]MBC3764935.1 general secretion pathway protein GspK [Neptunicella marina]
MLSKPNQPKGAALLVVLIIAIIMTILMSVASVAMSKRLALAFEAQNIFDEKVKIENKLSELSYLLATQRITVAGVSQGTNVNGTKVDDDGLFLVDIIGDELRTDGFMYTENGISFSIQNESGLIPFNTSDNYWIKKLLTAYKEDNFSQIRLTNSLIDYADADNWRQPSGAEKKEYEKLSFPEPPNFLLQKCQELYAVLNWPRLLNSHPDITNFCSLRRTAMINLNAVPLKLWQILWPQSQQKISQLRNTNKWFTTLSDATFAEPSFNSEVDTYLSVLGGYWYQLRFETKNQIYKLRIKIGNDTAKPVTVYH